MLGNRPGGSECRADGAVLPGGMAGVCLSIVVGVRSRKVAGRKVRGRRLGPGAVRYSMVVRASVVRHMRRVHRMRVTGDRRSAVPVRRRGSRTVALGSQITEKLAGETPVADGDRSSGPLLRTSRRLP